MFSSELPAGLDAELLKTIARFLNIKDFADRQKIPHAHKAAIQRIPLRPEQFADIRAQIEDDILKFGEAFDFDVTGWLNTETLS